MALEDRSGFTIISKNNYSEFCLVVAKQIEEQLTCKANSRLALPAGHSPRGYYKLLAQASQSNKIDWQHSKCFALDDYLEIDEQQSFQTFLENHLYCFTNLPANAKFNPRFQSNYDQLIAEQGGIDLCVLGLGINGHIAFNEPPTIATSWTHCVFLTNTTREANKDSFSDVVPSRAVTMGIATILASKRIILAVSGEHKKAALTRALQGPADPSCPASHLVNHPNLLVVTDFAFVA